MTRNEKRIIDGLIEQNIANFLDNNFWSKFPYGYKRQTDKKYQFAGVDVTVAGKTDLSVHFDEKAKIYGCLNSVYQYPSFEVSFINRVQEIQTGWFCQSLSTDYYAYIGVYANTNEINDLSCNNVISACDMLWVKKQDVIDYVQQTTQLSDLQYDAQELRNESELIGMSKNRKRYSNSNFWLTYSGQLYEKPVNLVMQRSTLENLKNSKHFFITKNKISRV